MNLLTWWKNYTIKYLFVFLLFGLALNSFGQSSTSYYNVTTYLNGKSVNVRKNTARKISVFSSNGRAETIIINSVPHGSYQRIFKVFQTEKKGGCTNYWTTDRVSNRTVLIKLCENEATPYFKRVNYMNNNIVKVIYYYYED